VVGKEDSLGFDLEDMWFLSGLTVFLCLNSGIAAAVEVVMLVAAFSEVLKIVWVFRLSHCPTLPMSSCNDILGFDR
jgi:hypothetical protein